MKFTVIAALAASAFLAQVAYASDTAPEPARPRAAAPDLAASERYYDAALRIDPHHRNTLEYSGELYLMKGDLAKAQSRLASLQAECGTSCSQYGDLKAAIDRYQSNGNKYVASGSW